MTSEALTPFVIAYDFDGTLAPGNMQEHSFIPALGMRHQEFWNKSNGDAKKQEGDPILLYMHHMLREAHYKNIPVRESNFFDHGSQVVLFPGVVEWFERINSAGEALGLKVRHFIISSGLREFIKGTEIASNFERIFASGYLYDENGVASAPAVAVNYTNKTQYLFRINKGALDVTDHKTINAYQAKAQRPVPFPRMMYIGDGDTDVPCFRLVTEQGGNSIAVYDEAKEGSRALAHSFVEDGRVRFAVAADYRKGEALEQRVLAILEWAAADQRLMSFPQRA